MTDVAPETFATPDDLGELHASELHTSLGESLAAQGEQAFMGGTRTLTQASQMMGAKYGVDPLWAASTIDDPAGQQFYNEAMAEQRAKPDVPLAAAQARIKQEGLEGKLKLPEQEAIRQPVLDLMIAHAHERVDYDAAVNRGPQNFAAGALGFVTQMGLGMIDPVNAAAFSIPVLGEARYGQMVARAGESLANRFAVKAGVGAAQGAVGGAALLPADWWLHTQDGQDFTMADALKSVVLSAGMGAAFMGAHGTVSDLLARYRGLPLSGSPTDLLVRGLTRPGPAVAQPIIPLEEVPGITAAEKPLARPPEGQPEPEGPKGVFDDVLEQLRAAGMGDEEAQQNAAVFAARYEARADRLGDGRDAYELYRGEGLTVQRPPDEEAELEGRVYGQGAISPEYEAALAAHSNAFAEFQRVTHDYRERRIGDQEFLAARAKYDEAQKAFDAAYAAEEARPPARAPAPAAEPGLFSEREAEGQQVLPGAERIGQGELAQRRAEQPLKPKAAQKPMDIGLFGDEANKKTLFQAPTFYSSAERAIAASRQEKASPEQWLATIKNTPGVKAEELHWLGLEDWLKEQKGAVSKQAIADYVRANQIEVREVGKREGGSDEEVRNWHDLSPEVWANTTSAERAELRSEFMADAAFTPEGDTKYQSYQLPGGQNYRELLLTLPEKSGERGPRGWGDTAGGTSDTTNFRSAHWDEPNILAHVRFNDRTIDGKKTLFLEEVQSDWHQAGKRKGYKQDVAKIDKAGMTAREVERYGQAYWQILDKDGNHYFSVPKEGNERGPLTTSEEAIDFAVKTKHATDMQGTVPDAPFKTTWPELALKRMIRYAAENGYDRIAWTPGEVQAERYDLSKHIKSITLRDNPSGGIGRPKMEGEFSGGMLSARDHQGFEVFSTYINEANELPEIIGKEAADKLMAVAPQEARSAGIGIRERRLGNADLKVGGEGMSGFYDKMLPAAANKLGKKFGAKAQRAEIETSSGNRYEGPEPSREREEDLTAEIHRSEPVAIARQWDDVLHALEFGGATFEEAMTDHGSIRLAEFVGGKMVSTPKGTPVHALDVTPQLRDAAVRQGFPLFQAGEQAPRGRITLQQNRAVVDLFKNADRSTFMHEAGHLWLEEMVRDAGADNAPEGVRNDLATILSWLGVEKPEQIGTEQHEQWARGFEQYLAEGKAPSSRLAQAFGKFKDWLIAIYHGLSSFGAPLSDDVRGVMDRMLATDKEIADFRNAPPHPAEVLADLPPAVQENVVQAAIADIINGRPVRAAEMLNEAGKQDPRIAESLNKQPPEPLPPAARRGPRSRDPSTYSLLEFLAAHGGIRNDDAQVADQEARGRRVYRGDQNPTGEAEANRIIEENQRHAEDELDVELRGIGEDPQNIPAARRARVLEIMAREGQSDPLEAWVQAVMEEDRSGVEAGQVEPPSEKIPGWDDDGSTASETGGRTAQEPIGEGAGDRAGPRAGGANDRAARQARNVEAWKKFAEPAGAAEDPDLAVASHTAEKAPEPPSVDVVKAPSAAQAAASEADKLLADILPQLTDDERKVFEDALNQMDMDNDAREQICRDGAECLAAAAAGAAAA